MKRFFDLLISASALLLLGLPLVILGIIVKFNLGDPVFFIQIRPGRGGKPFRMIKFRTMRDDYDIYGGLLPDVDRVTPFGLWLRNTSLDELPELWNIFCGDMSLVGPRPLLMEYLTLYNPVQARRHDVLPGLTGWAQINGRNAISWEEKFNLDVWYVDNMSFLLDIKILCMTVKKVISNEGISPSGEITMSRFKGNKMKES
jgi:lipopolysaccharide/colanic/teichoic acid biosynthesis glycosyltransferase